MQCCSVERGYQKNARATSYHSSGTVFSSAVASASGTVTIVVAAQRGHPAERRPRATRSAALTPKRVASTRSKAVGRAAALDVAEDGHARLEAGALLDLLRERIADAAESARGRTRRPRASLATSALADAYVSWSPSLTTTIEKCLPRVVALAELRADVVDVDRALGDQDRVGAAGDAAHARRSSRRAGPSPRRP